MIANILHDEGRERLPERQEGLGPYCRRLRGERTLSDVAKRAGLQVSSLKRIEDGDTKRLRSRTLAGLAIALRCPRAIWRQQWLGRPCGRMRRCRSARAAGCRGRNRMRFGRWRGRATAVSVGKRYAIAVVAAAMRSRIGTTSSVRNAASLTAIASRINATYHTSPLTASTTSCWLTSAPSGITTACGAPASTRKMFSTSTDGSTPPWSSR